MLLACSEMPGFGEPELREPRWDGRVRVALVVACELELSCVASILAECPPKCRPWIRESKSAIVCDAFDVRPKRLEPLLDLRRTFVRRDNSTSCAIPMPVSVAGEAERVVAPVALAGARCSLPAELLAMEWRDDLSWVCRADTANARRTTGDNLVVVWPR